MSEAGPTARLGFFMSACGHENHYKSHNCKTCGQPNMRAEDTTQAAAAGAAAALDVSAALNGQVLVHPAAAVVVEPYVVLQDFRTRLGEVTGIFKKGMVLNDWGLIANLKAQGSPIVPASQSSGVACCPQCHHVFPLVARAVGEKSAG